MELIRFVKTLQGEVIDLTIPPSEDHHYVIDDGIIWAAPDDVTLGMVNAVNCGTIVARSVDRKSLDDFCMPLEYFRFHSWCRKNNVKASSGTSIIAYAKHYKEINEKTFIPRTAMV
jgi:hypothetical protein